jgi:hypothetical protein
MFLLLHRKLRRELLVLEIWCDRHPVQTEDVVIAQDLWRKELLRKFRQLAEKN